MFNVSLCNGNVINDWKTARITPVYKGKGTKTELGNYRPISVIGHIPKIFEKCVHDQLLAYLETYNFLSVDQSAYLKNHSTQTLIHKITDTWLENIDDGLITGVCYFDVAKCFDSISHDVLLFKLNMYGIFDLEHKWFYSYLNCRTQATLCNNILSDFALVKSGVPQGSILGPLLFLLFMNDLPLGLSDCSMYADDTMVQCPGTTFCDVNNVIARDIENLSLWFNNNRLKLNVDKSCIMYIGSIQRLNSLNIGNHPHGPFVNDKILDISSNYKYLGLTVDSNLSWNKHVEELCCKLGARVRVPYRLSKILPVECLKSLYFSMVQSVIDYGLTVWGHTSKQNILKVQRFQNRAARICTTCYDFNISSSSLIKSLGWLTVTKRRDYLTLVLMYKCISSTAPDYLCDLFTYTNDIHDRNTRSADNMNLYVPKASSSSYSKSFSVFGAKLWNSIPCNTRNAPNIKIFKDMCKTFLLE